jgi:hypothetical protein
MLECDHVTGASPICIFPVKKEGTSEAVLYKQVALMSEATVTPSIDP